MIDHIVEYLEALQEVNEEFGLVPMLDPKGDALMLVSHADNSRVVVWLNSEELMYKSGLADVDMHELSNVVNGSEEEEEEGE